MSKKPASKKTSRKNPAKRKETVRQGVIAGTLDEHDEKLCRAAEDYRQAEGALEEARTELAESATHLIGLMQKKQRTTYRDPDGTLVTLKEIKARTKIDVQKVIPQREVAPPATGADGSQDAKGYAPLAESSKRKLDPDTPTAAEMERAEASQ